MNSLNENQIKLIEADVETARITLVNLSDELVDHICCEVERLMEMKGKSFDEAYKEIKKQTGTHVLQKIQQNTLYLIDKNYKLMKNTMKITGNISLSLIAFGTIFKIMYWPGATMLLVVGFVLLCFLFFPAAIYINNKDGKKTGRTLLNISILIGGITFIMGILFKVMHWPSSMILLFVGWSVIVGIFLPILLFVKVKEAKTSREKRIYVLGVIAIMIFELATMFKMFHWPGASLMMILGSLLLFAFFLPMFTFLKFSKPEAKTGEFIFLITTLMYAIVFTALLSMNVSGDVLGHFVNIENNSSKINKYFEKKKESLLKAELTMPDSLKIATSNKINQVRKEADNLKNAIAQIKLNLVKSVELVDEQTAKRILENPTEISKKDNYDFVNMTMLGPDGKAGQLKEKIQLFTQKILNMNISNSKFSQSIYILLNTDDQKDGLEYKTWAEINFRNNMLVTTLGFLSSLEKNVRMVECEAIQQLRQTK